MAKNKGNRFKRLNAGKLMTTKMTEQHLSLAALARLAERKQSTVTALLKRTSMQVYIIWEFGLLMKHNFFADLAQQFQESAGEGWQHRTYLTEQARINELEKEVAQLREELNYLRKALDVLTR